MGNTSDDRNEEEKVEEQFQSTTNSNNSNSNDNKKHTRRRSKVSDFEKIKLIGRGAYGEVFKVRRKEDDLMYVIKRISLGELDEKEQMDAIKEVRLMADIEHPHVVKYYDSMVKDDQLHIVMEYCNR